jgi:xylan 1,4-beta-xylosidase
LKGAGAAGEATIQRIDLEHANAKRRWEQMGKPDYLSAALMAELDTASRLHKEPQAAICQDGTLRLEVAMPPQSVASVEFTY